MKQRKWHKGPPPHVGWWNASLSQSPYLWRWWNGAFWSQTATQKERPKAAAFWAGLPTRSTGVEWTTYYPKNARVPRIDPRKKGAK